MFFQVGQIARGYDSSDDITGAADRMHVTRTTDGLVRLLPLPLGPYDVLSTPHFHLVPNGLDPHTCRPKWRTAIQQM